MKNKTQLLLAAAIAATLAAAPTSAQAELIYGINGANQLVSFDSANPNSLLSTVTITGATILNIDIRPATSVLYGLSDANSLYTLNIGTGVASLVGATTIADGFDYGFDFNPTVDRIRVINDAGSNYRLVPTSGATTNDLALDYTTGDPNAAATPSLVGAAYTNNFVGAVTTTLYGIDATLDILARSTNANNGTYVTQGGLGVDITGLAGFDISGITGLAYASLSTDSTTSQLYTIDLTTGAASLVGGIGSVAGDTILDIATVVPEPATAGILALGALGLAGFRRFRRLAV